MICLDQLMRKRSSNSGGGSADLTPIYNSLSALSINKLESTAFTFFTNTLTISGAGLPYQINFSDVSVLSANSGCLYNITDTISDLSLTTTSFVKITGPEMISNNTLNMRILDLNAKEISSNSITLSGTGDLNAYRILSNSFVGSDYKGYLELKANNIFNNTLSSLYGNDLKGCQVSSNTITYGKLVNISAPSLLSNTIYSNQVFNLSVASGNKNSIRQIGNLNLIANGFTGNTLVSVDAGFLNVSFGSSNSLSSVGAQIVAKSIYNNTIRSCNLMGRIDTFSTNTISGGWIDVKGAALKQNSMSGDELIYGNGKSFDGNSIHDLKHCDLKYISNVNSNTFGNLLDVKLNVDVSFKSNSLTDVGKFECDVGYYPGFLNNSIHAYSLSFKDLETDIFTNNSFTIGNFLDFNYGSSNVYDASLNYLLSDYVPESKVLGKYNLVPYVRNLMNGGAGKQSVCAFGVNFSDQINLFPDTLGTLNMNWNFSETGMLVNVGTLLNKSIDKGLINNWNITSGGVSGISCSGVVFDSLYYNGAHNKYINTGRLFVGDSDAGNYIRHLYFTNNAVYTSGMDTVNDIYPVFSGIEMGSVSASYFQNQFGYCNMLKNTIKNYQIQGLIPNLAAKSCSISVFNFRDFTYVPTPLDSTNPHIMNCTINSVYFTSDTTFSESRIFNRCSIKNALVVCTPLAWDMSSAQFRSAMAEALNGLYNTTTDVIPMTYAETWPI